MKIIFDEAKNTADAFVPALLLIEPISFLLLLLWCRPWPWLKSKGIVAVTPYSGFEQPTDGQFQPHLLADVEIGRDDGLGGPAARHGVEITAYAYVRACAVAKADIGIAAVVRGADVRAECGADDGTGAVVVAECVELKVVADVEADVAAYAVLRYECVLHGHPVFVGYGRSREM